MSEAGIVAVMLEDETKLVVRGEAPTLTTEVVLKPVPITVIVKPASPTVFEVGEMALVVGTVLFTVKVWAFEVPPPGVPLTTVILKVPGAVMSEAGIVAVMLEDDTKDVVRAEPSKLTVEDALKPVPVTVIVKVEAPTVLEFGEIELVVGT